MQVQRVTGSALGLAVMFAISACSEGPTAPGAPQLALAADLTCTGPAIGGTYGNVVVPSGASCFMEGVTVQGSIKVQPNAALFIPETVPSTIGGDVDAVKANSVDVRGANIGGHFSSNESGLAISHGNTVGGKIQIVKSTGTLAVATLNTVLNGDIKLEGNRVTTLLDAVGNNVLKGNMLIYQNTGAADKQVHTNTISGSLDCKANHLPFFAGLNTAAKQQGQCAP